MSESDKIVTSGFEPEGAKLVRQIKTRLLPAYK
nr:MAG TPA: hypothetical protein [Caudoviricetes sp.]